MCDYGCTLGYREKKKKNGQYYNTDGSDSSYTFWGPDQPDDNKPGNCVAVRADNDYRWDDTNCNEVRHGPHTY